MGFGPVCTCPQGPGGRCTPWSGVMFDLVFVGSAKKMMGNFLCLFAMNPGHKTYIRTKLFSEQQCLLWSWTDANTSSVISKLTSTTALCPGNQAERWLCQHILSCRRRDACSIIRWCPIRTRPRRFLCSCSSSSCSNAFDRRRMGNFGGVLQCTYPGSSAMGPFSTTPS